MPFNKKEPVILNLWQKIRFVCGKRDEKGEMCKNPMHEEMIGKIPCLSCSVCGNYISYYDVEKFASVISKMSVEASKDGEDINFSNFKHRLVNKYSKENVYFNVLEDKKGHLTVALSKEAL